MATPKEFAVALLNRLGLQPTKNRIIGIVDFAAREGGHWNNSARYNPLNTTRNMSGAVSKNSAGVKAYTSWGQGIEATALTLLQTAKGFDMSPIVNALKADADPHIILKSVTATPWCPQSSPGCAQYDVGDLNALYLSYANKNDNGTALSATGTPPNEDFLTKYGSWLLVGGLLLVGAGAWYVSTKPGGFKGFIGMGARENPARRSRSRAQRNPLKGGSSRATISANIRKLHHEHPQWAHNRVVAAALNNARRTSRGALPPYLRTG
jgi:hypothetical protein